MAKLIKCKTCGGQLSAKAEACPHCGENKKKSSSGGGTSGFTIFVILAAIVYAFMPDSTHPTPARAYTSTKPKVHAIPKLTAEQKLAKAKANAKTVLKTTIKELKTFNNFKSYKNITVEKLGQRVKHMRTLGKNIFFQEEVAKKDKTLLSLWQKAKKLQIQTQVKHYPLMRDALGPLLREKMWEHNMHVVTTGKGYTRIILTAAIFASNSRIKQIHETMGITYSDYRFKRADYKWIKHDTEWTYFTLNTKKDNEL